jgi:hypothetical protein
MTSLTDDSCVPLVAIQELIACIDASNLEILDPTITNVTKEEAVKDVLTKTGFPFATMAENDFLLSPYSYKHNACIIGVPCPSSKYRVIERCIAIGIPAFLLVQTTVFHSKTLNEIIRRYSTESKEVNVSIVIPFRRIHFSATAKCPFDTVWLGLNTMNRVSKQITFAKPWFTERQKRKLEGESNDAARKKALSALEEMDEPPIVAAAGAKGGADD